MSTQSNLSAAFDDLTHTQALALYDAVAQFIENADEVVELITESADEPSKADQAILDQHAAAQVVLDRCDAAIAADVG